jgi:hypothetical protein
LLFQAHAAECTRISLQNRFNAKSAVQCNSDEPFCGAAVCLSATADEITLRNGTIRSAEAGEGAIDWSGAGASALPGSEAMLIGAQGEPTKVALRDTTPINARPEEGDPMRHVGHVMVQAIYTRGNADSEHVYADGKLTGRSKPSRYALAGKLQRRSSPAIGTTTAWRGSGNYDRFLNDAPFAYVRGWLEHNEPRGIDQLALVGAGLGRQLVDTLNHDLSVRGGLDYVTLDRIAGTDTDFPGLGWGIDWRYVPIGWSVELFHDQLGLWSLENTDNVFLRSRTGVRLPLAGGLRGVAQVNINWERGAARSSTETTLILGLDYTWGQR